MKCSFCIAATMTLLLATNAFGLTIGVNGSVLPFTFAYVQGETASFEPVLQAVNDSTTAAIVLSWQLNLEARPLPGAQGSLQFHSGTAPPDSLFGQLPGPFVELTEPSETVRAFDSDTEEFTGKMISQMAARNILELTLIATPDASGTFQVVTPVFDAMNPEVGSSWFAADSVEPSAFGNATPSAFAGFVLVGTVNVTQQSQPGDYNGDGDIDSLDYSHWVQSFRGPVPQTGNHADGNRDATIDAADYVLWRKFTNSDGSGNGELPVPLGVPEPSCWILVIFALSWTVATRANR